MHRGSSQLFSEGTPHPPQTSRVAQHQNWEAFLEEHSGDLGTTLQTRMRTDTNINELVSTDAISTI